MIRAYEIILGAQLGNRAKEAVMKIWDRWAEKDPGFVRVTEFYSAADNSAYGFMSTCVLPKFYDWIGKFWKFLKGSNDVVHATTINIGGRL